MEVLFLLFIIYSFLGWLMESILVSVKDGRVVNRGFLIGPICPIYGVGALLMTIALEKYYNDILVLFVLATVLGAILEYFTSYIMEKIFKVRWWDYSNDRYNINGRICLKASVCFGFLGVIMIKFLNPFFMFLLNLMAPIFLRFVFLILFLCLIFDVVVSFSVVSKVRKVDLRGFDASEEISFRVKEKLRSYSFFTNRLVDAFPNLKIGHEFKKFINNFEKKSK